MPQIINIETREDNRLITHKGIVYESSIIEGFLSPPDGLDLPVQGLLFSNKDLIFRGDRVDTINPNPAKLNIYQLFQIESIEDLDSIDVTMFPLNLVTSDDLGGDFINQIAYWNNAPDFVFFDSIQLKRLCKLATDITAITGIDSNLENISKPIIFSGSQMVYDGFAQHRPATNEDLIRLTSLKAEVKLDPSIGGLYSSINLGVPCPTMWQVKSFPEAIQIVITEASESIAQA